MEKKLEDFGEVWLSDAVTVPSGDRLGENWPGTLPSETVNACAKTTGVHVSDTLRFDKTWREGFMSALPKEQVDEFFANGLSAGRNLKFQVMCIPANKWFRVHIHPNIEYIQCLRGRMHEFRMRGEAVFPRDSSEPVLHAHEAEWVRVTTSEGHDIGNPSGSVHQSFTESDPAVLLVLWSGCHMNIRPANCHTNCPELRPYAGW